MTTKELISIEQKDGKETVNARELHQFLEVGRDFSNWIKDRIEKYGFQEGEDFVTEVSANSGEKGGRPQIQYHLSLDMAKELSMVENNDKGRQARLYFIEVEKKAREVFTGPMLLAKAVLEAQTMLAHKDQVILEMKPKAEFFDAVAGTKDAIRMGQAAKILDFVNVGRNSLFEILRDHKVLQANNQPYQTQVDAGRFRVILQEYQTPDGETHINSTTLVYPKGMEYIRKLLIQEGYSPRGAA